VIEGRPPHGNALDPGWIWARTDIARLLSAGLEKSLIPVECVDDIWALLAMLAEDGLKAGARSGEVDGAAFRTRHWLSYSSWRRHQRLVSLRPSGARSSHCCMPQRPSTPRS
jgi:hypothetical protein